MLVERNDAKVGLFVMGGLGVFIALFLLANARKVVEHSDRIRVQLESLEGVAVGTEVDLQGHRVGQVESVEFKQEGVHVHFLVTLSVRDTIRLWKGTKVAVVPKGLGGSAMELQLPPEEERTVELPRNELLHGEPGVSLPSILVKVDGILDDLGAVTQEMREKGADYLLDRPQMRALVQRLTATLQSFETVGEEVRTVAAKGGRTLEGLDRNLALAESSLKELNRLLAKRGPELDETLARLPKVLRQMEELSGELLTLTRAEGPELHETFRALQKDLKSLGELIELIKQKPNRIIWGTPSEAEKEKARKAAEGK